MNDFEDGVNGLWQDVKSGDEHAFRTVMLLCRPRLLLHSYNILLNFEEAEDVLQDFFVEVWLKKAQLDIHTSFYRYMTRAIKRNSLVRVRSQQVEQKRNSNYTYHLDHTVAGNNLEIAEMGSVINKAIDDLPESYRDIIKSIYLDGKTHRQIVEEQNLRLQTVKNYASLALGILRRKLHFLK